MPEAMTPAEHGQEPFPIVECPECGHAIQVVPAADNRALEESAAEFEAKFEQAAAEAETLEAERRALVEALREIANWDYGGQALRCNEMAQAALDRIQEGKP